MVVDKQDNFRTAVDTSGIRDEADGSVSAIVAMFYVDPFQTDKDGTQWIELAGRVAFKCKVHQAKTLIVHAIAKSGKIQAIQGRDSTYSVVPDGTIMDAAGAYVCNTSHPATTEVR